MTGLGKTLIYLGLFLIVMGLIFSLGGKIPWLGHLPGDIYIQRERFTFYFPLTTSIVLSLLLTALFALLRR